MKTSNWGTARTIVVVAVGVACSSETGKDGTSTLTEPSTLQAKSSSRTPLQPASTLDLTTSAILDPGPPDRVAFGSRSSERSGMKPVFRVPPVAQMGCTLDFTNEDALIVTEPSLWFDRVYIPWYQHCAGAAYVDLRPLLYGHFHLGFADSDVVPCNSHPQAFPARIDDDETCELVDIPSEPRTYLTTHLPTEYIRLRAYDYYYKILPFALNQIRVLGYSAVRLCYRKVQEIDPSEWETSEPASSSPGVWNCWSELGVGTWDLSAWAWDIDEVKITASDPAGGPFSLDDIVFGIP